MMAYTGTLCPERGTFFGLQVYERVGILIFSWKYTKGVGKSVIWVCERTQRANR